MQLLTLSLAVSRIVVVANWLITLEAPRCIWLVILVAASWDVQFGKLVAVGWGIRLVQLAIAGWGIRLVILAVAS